jgi:hypothetical protein
MPHALYEFIEAPAFSRYREDYLDDDELLEVQLTLIANPDAGDLIPDAGGLRKVRWSDKRRSKGKRGGLRIIYYAFLSENEIWLMTLYSKDEMDDLTKVQRRALSMVIQTEKAARARERRKGTK